MVILNGCTQGKIHFLNLVSLSLSLSLSLSPDTTGFVSNESLELLAIKDLHSRLDDNNDGQVDLQESDEVNSINNTIFDTFSV